MTIFLEQLVKMTVLKQHLQQPRRHGAAVAEMEHAAPAPPSHRWAQHAAEMPQRERAAAVVARRSRRGAVLSPAAARAHTVHYIAADVCSVAGRRWPALSHQ